MPSRSLASCRARPAVYHPSVGRARSTSLLLLHLPIEDLDALIARAGGSVGVSGYSSGAILALRAAAQGVAISRLAFYEPPPTGARAGELAPQLAELLAAGRRGDAVELFQVAQM